MTRSSFDVGSVSHVGCLRSENQDWFVSDPQEGIFIVADGMGGHEGGSIASQMASKAAHAWLMEHPFDVAGAISWAHEQVAKNSKDAVRGMGTTLVVVQLRLTSEFSSGDFYVAWCGDSRMYVLTGQSIAQVSTDHSMVQGMVDAGQLSAEAALTHPKRHILTHAVGLGPLRQLRVDQISGPIQEGERILLCTDGLTNEVGDVEIGELGRENKNVQKLAEKLIDKALEYGGRDNVTAIIIGGHSSS